MTGPLTERLAEAPAGGRTPRCGVIAGVGSAVPETVVTNADLAVRSGADPGWVWSRTGIRRRRVAATGQSTSDLAVTAGRRALVHVDPARVDTLVLATTTPDHPCPATAPSVASALGLTEAAAFDVNAVCAGFVYGLAACCGMVAAGISNCALLIGADTYSTIVDPADRVTAPLFGDGAGAVIVRAGGPDEPGAVTAFDLGSDGSLSDLIMIEAGGSRERSRGHAQATSRFLRMHGPAVYRHAVDRMTRSSLAVLARADWGPDRVDRFVAHQANARILATVARNLGIPDERVVANIAEVGNTAAASIPLLLHQKSVDGTIRAGDRVLMTAFGGGASWGSAAMVWPALPGARQGTG